MENIQKVVTDQLKAVSLKEFLRCSLEWENRFRRCIAKGTILKGTMYIFYEMTYKHFYRTSPTTFSIHLVCVMHQLLKMSLAVTRHDYRGHMDEI